MNTGALLLTLLRGAHVAAMLSLFGTLVFGVAMLAPARRAAPEAVAALDRRLAGMARLGAGLALLLGAAWFVMETAALGGRSSVPAVVALLPAVALHTQFGHWLTGRLVLLLAVLLLPSGQAARWLALPLAAAAVAVQPMFGHAGATPGAVGTLLIAAEALHLLAAGAWLGGLPPLCCAIRRLPPAAAARACVRFSTLGLVAVGLIVGTAMVLATVLVGSLPALVGTLYGRLVLLKAGLLLLALALAARNRFVLTGRLAAGARAALLWSIGAETAVGLAIVLAAALLAAQMPGADHPLHAQLAGWLGA